jgi:hypothetical protein
MSNNEYSFSDKKKIVEEILTPFFQSQTSDTTHVDYILLLKKCILALDIFKNSTFETLGISFVYDEIQIQSQIENIIKTINKLQDINSLSIILNEAFSYFAVNGQFSQFMQSATVTFSLQQTVTIPVDDNIFLNNNFYNKIKELISNTSLSLSNDDFAYLNALCIYYIIKYIADCTFIQLTLPNGVIVPLHAMSKEPMPIDPLKTTESILDDNMQLFSDSLKEFSDAGSFAQIKINNLTNQYNLTSSSFVIFSSNNNYNI